MSFPKRKLHEQNQHASCIQPIKNNFARTKSKVEKQCKILVVDDNLINIKFIENILRKANYIVEYAGANCPLYLIRNNGKHNNVEFIVKKANRMPVGMHPNDDQDFTNHKIKLHNGDKLYLFSDGYVAQFGGGHNKTFRTKRFQDVLLNIQNKPMSKQSKILDKTIENWRGDCEQVDDILVLGVHINLPEIKT